MDPSNFAELNIAPRILLGPGPSMVHPRVMKAIAAPVVGHLDPQHIQVMDDVQELLRYIFQTKNEVTLPISGTGSAGMEAAMSNFIEPGDHVLVAVSGYFGERLLDIASRYGAVADRIDRSWGEVFSPDEIRTALKKNKYKLLVLVHGETSTGVRQTGIKTIAEAAHEHGALFVLDTVASLGAVPVEVDAWDVDICYSGSQKALSAPPGLAPITVGPRAKQALESRKTKVANWYLDLSQLMNYWGPAKKYHHTAPVSLNYALREALLLALEEGHEDRFARHNENARLLWEGLDALGLPPLVTEENRLVTLTTPKLPDSLDEVNVRVRLRDEHNIEIAGGFGPLAGKVWRIGLMGYSSRTENVKSLLSALEDLLN